MPNVAITDRAQSAINSLAPTDRDRVAASIDTLRTEGPRPTTPPHAYVVLDHNGQPLSVLRATPTLRLLFTVEGDVVLIQDVVNHDIIENYFRNAG